jgi:hypothetical protein
MKFRRALSVVAVLAALVTVASPAQAQIQPQSLFSQPEPSVLDHRWSVDVGMGFDRGITGNINSGAIGVINTQPVVIVPNSYDDVYGVGYHLRFGGGYLIDEVTEVRAMFAYQSLGADLTGIGTIGSSTMLAQYDPYKTFSLDGGFRRYVDVAKDFRAYAEATLGIGFISELDVVLVAPAAGLAADATDFYDRTAAFSVGGNVGLLWQISDRLGLYGQLGVRWLSGMSAVDGLAGTGLEKINDNSSRWTMPLVVGLRAHF